MKLSTKPILRATVLAAAAVALIACYLAVTEAVGARPRCLVKGLTGWDCPGCGSQRALEALLRGDLWGAVSCNYLLPLLLAYLLVPALHWIAPESQRIKRLYDRATSPPALMAIVAITLAWMLIRNLAGI